MSIPYEYLLAAAPHEAQTTNFMSTDNTNFMDSENDADHDGATLRLICLLLIF